MFVVYDLKQERNVTNMSFRATSFYFLFTFLIQKNHFYVTGLVIPFCTELAKQSIKKLRKHSATILEPLETDF